MCIRDRGAPVYVCAKDMQANTVTVGPEENLFDRIVYADEVNLSLIHIWCHRWHGQRQIQPHQPDPPLL